MIKNLSFLHQCVKSTLNRGGGEGGVGDCVATGRAKRQEKLSEVVLCPLLCFLSASNWSSNDHKVPKGIKEQS